MPAPQIKWQDYAPFEGLEGEEESLQITVSELLSMVIIVLGVGLFVAWMVCYLAGFARLTSRYEYRQRLERQLHYLEEKNAATRATIAALQNPQRIQEGIVRLELQPLPFERAVLIGYPAAPKQGDSKTALPFSPRALGPNFPTQREAAWAADPLLFASPVMGYE
ncbi:MAG TPA: LapA family protein [Armatimonadetes bacterium]|nr:LapA family protein [Armatimonadota bacterium]